MISIQCKMCGRSLELSAGITAGNCTYCGSRITFPRLSDERAGQLYILAERCRRNNDFDKALNIYRKLQAEAPDDPEYSWGAVLCRYGISYAEEPDTRQWVPVCRRLQNQSILTDQDFRHTIETAGEGERGIYEQEARRIAELQKKFLAIASQTRPYDIFICCRETAEDGTRTEDSMLAQEICQQLTAEGLRVFFARTALAGKNDRESEPYIFAALNSAKVMLIIWAGPEYCSSVQVRNDWSRYLALREKDPARQIIPCFRNMDADDIPTELLSFPRQDMSRLGFQQDLLQDIRNVLANARSVPNTEMQAEEEEKDSGNASLLKRARIFLAEGDWESAAQYSNRVLDIDMENAEAYSLLFMCDFKLNSPEQLDIGMLEEYVLNKNYRWAEKFAAGPEPDSMRQKLLSAIEQLTLQADREFSELQEKLEHVHSLEEAAEIGQWLPRFRNREPEIRTVREKYGRIRQALLMEKFLPEIAKADTLESLAAAEKNIPAELAGLPEIREALAARNAQLLPPEPAEGPTVPAEHQAPVAPAAPAMHQTPVAPAAPAVLKITIPNKQQGLKLQPLQNGPQNRPSRRTQEKVRQPQQKKTGAVILFCGILIALTVTGIVIYQVCFNTERLRKQAEERCRKYPALLQKKALDELPQNGRKALKAYPAVPEEVIRRYAAAENGDASAQYAVAEDLLNGTRYVLKNDAEAFKQFKKAAEQGHADAQYSSGWMYQNGRGVIRDEKEAFRWYRIAAEQGNAAAQNQMGLKYSGDRNTGKNDAEAVKWFSKAAGQGHADAQNNLGCMYRDGRGGEKNNETAVKWFSKAAGQGHAGAQNNLGCMYRDGRGCARNEREAVKWYRKAAEQGNAAAQNNLGWMYLNGRGVRKNEAEAFRWYRKAAESGDSAAQVHLGWMYSNGRGCAIDKQEAVKWYRKAAEQGNTAAQSNLGWMYQNGRGVRKNEAEAFRWYRKAADGGRSEAQYHLAESYEYGRGTDRNFEKAREWYLKAAEQGHPLAGKRLKAIAELQRLYEIGEKYIAGKDGADIDYKEAFLWHRRAAVKGYPPAQWRMGWLYRTGNGTYKSVSEAVKWYRTAAEHGNVNAQLDLGWMYSEGKEVPQNDEEAVKWYRKAAEQGNAVAQNNLGWMYSNGRGVGKDAKEAVKWYRKAAEQGNAAAQNNLGCMYQNGRGVDRDEEEAVKWYRKAAEQGNENAQKALEKLGREVPQSRTK